jgi:hypothetical protein
MKNKFVNIRRAITTNFFNFCVGSLVCLAATVSTAEMPSQTILISQKRTPGFNSFANVAMKNGPIRADAKSVQLQVDMKSMGELFDEQALIRFPDRGFYRERRDFRNPTISVEVNYDNHPTTSLKIALKKGEDIDQTLPLSGFVKSFNFLLAGESDYFKCFNSETCVKEETRTEKIFPNNDRSVEIKLFEEIVACEENQIVIERKISDSKRQKVRINNPVVLSVLGISQSQLEGFGDAATSPTDFAGFSEVLNKFPDGDPQREAHVFRDFGGIKIKVDTQPFFTCHYRTHAEGTTSLVNRLGRHCPSLDGYFYSHATLGSDTGYFKDYFFKSCRNLD